jgi:5-methylcytosine-specific restriction protein A
MKPPRICSCGQIVAHAARCQCQQTQDRERKARHDARRPSARARGYNHEWRKQRAAYLITHPYCSMPDCDRCATVVDHIIRHRGDRALFWNRANWQPLCAPCHNSTKQRQERNQ